MSSRFWSFRTGTHLRNEARTGRATALCSQVPGHGQGWSKRWARRGLNRSQLCKACGLERDSTLPKSNGGTGPANPLLPSGPTEQKAEGGEARVTGAWAARAASHRVMRAHKGHKSRPRSSTRQPWNANITTPRPWRVQGPPSPGLRRHQGLPHSVLPPTSDISKVNSTCVSRAPHPGQETGRAESSQPTSGTRTEI